MLTDIITLAKDVPELTLIVCLFVVWLFRAKKKETIDNIEENEE